MATTPSTTPETTFPKAGTTTPSSASPATPSSGGSGSRPADAAIDPAAAAAERDVLRRVVQGAHEAVDRIADKAIPAVERLRGSYNDAAETLKQRADQAVDLKDEWTESLRTAVREHPLTAIGAALALGVLIAKLTSNNNNER